MLRLQNLFETNDSCFPNWVIRNNPPIFSHRENISSLSSYRHKDGIAFLLFFYCAEILDRYYSRLSLHE